MRTESTAGLGAQFTGRPILCESFCAQGGPELLLVPQDPDSKPYLRRSTWTSWANQNPSLGFLKLDTQDKGHAFADGRVEGREALRTPSDYFYFIVEEIPLSQKWGKEWKLEMKSPLGSLRFLISMSLLFFLVVWELRYSSNKFSFVPHILSLECLTLVTNVLTQGPWVVATHPDQSCKNP